MIDWLTAGFAFFCGVIIGSFLNVVIWRLPRGGSLSVPAWSYCPRCEHRLGALDLFPVLSYLFLGCKCRYCRARISVRYPAIELLTACVFFAVAAQFGASFDTIFYCVFAAALICVVFIDIEHFIIPDGLNVFIALVGFGHNAVGILKKDPGQWAVIGGIHAPASLVGFAVYGVAMYTIGLVSYVVLVACMDKLKNPFRAAIDYVAENVMDWCFIFLDCLGLVIPPLRRFAVAAPPVAGTTAEEIEADEDAGGVGGGDGKLAAAIGANLFAALALQSLFFSIVIGAMVGVVILIRRGRSLGSRTPMPFGPAMVCGALVSLFSQGRLLDWYSSLLHPQ